VENYKYFAQLKLFHILSNTHSCKKRILRK